MSFDSVKTDPALGKKVHLHLVSLGLETPIDDSKISVNKKLKISTIETHITSIMETLGMDLSDDSLIGTPTRVANMMVREQYWGLDTDKFPKCTTVQEKFGYDQVVKCEAIQVMSNCEHHLVVIDGLATVAYIPKDRVLGLSKINRIVEYFSRRPQIQERLTCQIFEAISMILGTEDVAVSITAKHYCVASRGVSDALSKTTTSKLGGAFKTENATRAEFFALQQTHGVR